uniref:RNA-directed DNA polymerase n=1 Tax=Amazona collaria TaxID=241587 RepID=A0A8B9FDS4_9PSIT
MTNFGGKVTPHHPPHKLFSLTTEIEIKLVSKCQRNPAEGPTYFTDSSGKTGRAITVWFENNEWHHEEQKVQGSAQIVELAAVVFAFQHCHRALNLVTDSNYVAGVVTRIENSWLKEVTNPTLFYYLKMLKMLLDECTTPYYVLHIRSHTDLPGFIVEGNRRADRLTAPVVATPQPNQLEQARLSHAFYHQSARSLRKQFSLSWSEACTIVQICPDCQPFATHPHTGVNPSGTSALQLWQSDVTHIPEFGRQKYVHISIDTFSHMVWASAETGEKARNVTHHWRGAFAALGVPKQIKTDNGPAYNSKVIETFLNTWGIKHKTGIPHSPQGQAVVERCHLTLKMLLEKQKGGMKGESPQARLYKAIYVLNFLTIGEGNETVAVTRHILSHSKILLNPIGVHQLKVWVKSPQTLLWEGSHPLITWGRGYACVSTDHGPWWIPARLVRPVLNHPAVTEAESRGSQQHIDVQEPAALRRGVADSEGAAPGGPAADLTG